MDPLSHVALAHNLIRLRRDARAPSGLIPAAILGALAPDIDLFLLPLGWDRYMVAHEVGTHSLVGGLVCGVLAAALGRLFWRRGRYRAMVGAALIGVVSHLGFDVFSGATLRLWWPLLDTPLANVGLFAMADPWVAGLCFAAVAAITSQRNARRPPAVIFAIVLLLFAAGKAISRYAAEQVVHTRIAASSDLLILPVWGSLTQWEVYGEEAERVNQWIVDARSGSLDLKMTVASNGATPEQDALVAESMTWQTVRNFRRTHQFAFPHSVSPSGDARVLWSDLRYCEANADATAACGVNIGGERSGAGWTHRLIVMIGNVVQTR